MAMFCNVLLNVETLNVETMLECDVVFTVLSRLMVLRQ
jgi:hypothetical protein